MRIYRVLGAYLWKREHFVRDKIRNSSNNNSKHKIQKYVFTCFKNVIMDKNYHKTVRCLKLFGFVTTVGVVQKVRTKFVALKKR